MELLNTTLVAPPGDESSAAASGSGFLFRSTFETTAADLRIRGEAAGSTAGWVSEVSDTSRSAGSVAARSASITHSTVAQWEGQVKEILPNGDIIAHLRALSLVGAAAPASAEGFEEWATIPREQIESEDTEYVRPGATFYLTVLKQNRTKLVVGGHTVVIAFRRLPAWSTPLIQLAQKRAEKLHARIKQWSAVPCGEPNRRRSRSHSAYQAYATTVTTRK